MDQQAARSSKKAIGIRTRVRDISNDSVTGGQVGTVTKLGTWENGWQGYAWVKYDRSPAEWVDMHFLEAL